MSEFLPVVNNIINANPNLVTWGVSLALLLICLVSQKTFISEIVNEFKLNRLIKKLGRESLHHVVVPDGMDGKVYIEHLVLTSDRILLLSIKRFRGTIFAAEKIDYWTQVIGKKSYKFENPLHQLESGVISLSSYVKTAKIESKVLFVNGSSFPKGKPGQVVSVDEIRELNREYKAGEISDALRTDWKRLQDLAISDEMPGNKELFKETAQKELNAFSLISCSALLALWLVMRLV